MYVGERDPFHDTKMAGTCPSPPEEAVLHQDQDLCLSVEMIPDEHSCTPPRASSQHRLSVLNPILAILARRTVHHSMERPHRQRRRIPHPARLHPPRPFPCRLSCCTKRHRGARIPSGCDREPLASAGQRALFRRGEAAAVCRTGPRSQRVRTPACGRHATSK